MKLKKPVHEYLYFQFANKQNCATNKIDSKIEEELVVSILKLAAKFEKEKKTKKN